MTLLPDDLQPFQKKAEEYISKGRVHDVEFSGGTYQVQVQDAASKKDVWAFLQIDPRGNLKDYFCSCEELEEIPACEHVAAAYLSIYNNQPKPLHQRFEYSLWNRLCELFSDRYGDDASILKRVKQGYYVHKSLTGKLIFYIKASTTKTISKLRTIIEERKKETEETSLKFSNLTEEELDMWRSGNPTPHLRYELSFWNDLAHWMMIQKERKISYKIKYDYASTGIPNQIIISFPQLELGFYISEANLPIIIPALDTVESPLTVHHASQDAIKNITYDKINGALIINPKSAETAKKKKAEEISNSGKGTVIGDWLYVPKDGFYARDPHRLLATPRLTDKQLSEALSEHFRVIQPLLDGVSLHSEPISLSYTLSFDSEWNLHITAYAFSPGDLSTSHSRYFDNWVYIDDDGFYPVESAQFKALETVIPAQEVADFVQHERSWLNTQEGFHAHLSSIESQLTYNLSPQNRLSFSRLLPALENKGESKDFGSWVYVAGQGFFAKISLHAAIPVRPDITITPDQIPLFIRMNIADLALVPNFFSKKCPVLKAGLKIDLTDDDEILVSPEYSLLPEYKDKDVRFFDDYVYTEGEGFHEMPPDSRLPERFRHPIHIPPSDFELFLTYELESLRPFATIDPRLLPPKHIDLVARSIAKIGTQERGWYGLKLFYETDRGAIPVTTLWAAIKNKNQFAFAKAGQINLALERFDWIRHLHKNRIDRRSNTIQMSTMELIRLNALEELHVVDEESEKILKELTEFHIPGEPNLTGLKGQLWPYQKLGAHWLWFLYHHGLSGLLCDDMGLGKTHQAMALLVAITNFHKENPLPEKSSGSHFLVVCPTSVIFHWQEKLAEYLPELRICTFYGSDRNIEAFHQQYDVLLTSYGIWRIEHEMLSELHFEIAIFDEIQIAKNQNSRIHATLKTVNARMRLGLTGTPLENNLRELKSLFDIALPTYMPGEAEYREIFVKPIEKLNDPDKKALLTRFIKPFVLRRKKEEVLLDLPEKIEEISHCTLLPTQMLLYNQVLQQSREKILEEMHGGAAPVPYIHIFALLSSLKQICNHPAAYLKVPADYVAYESGKWELFVELLSEARESSQKVVVFTQYLAMLDIFENYLNEMGVGYATIRGATINRGEQVHRFNNDPDCEVFLGSLQASGLGVDLTAGSVVIHYDRWWNAARENQATDRVHRIGQTRGVQVFKLVTKGTFEERIDALIAKKGKLMEDVVGIDDHRFIKKFSREEILQLLQDVEEAK